GVMVEVVWSCIFLSSGFPSGLPGENFNDKVLEGLTSSIMSRLKVAQTVLMPDSSTPLAISPTD
ncbi:MAG: hypothetical protein L0956_04210, partial [Candidatus Mariimomonas ferrooxydans]